MQKNNIYIPLLLALILALGMQLGFKMYEALKGKPKSVSAASVGQLPELNEVLNYVQNNYVDEVNPQELEEDIIQATLEELDPHSNYISPKELQGVNESLQGEFEGIGVEFSIVKDTILVVTPISGGPSEKLGIRAGDKIIQIEDSLVAGVGITNEKVVKRLRGKKGTNVKVSIYRKGVSSLIDYKIERDAIPLVSVDVGYMLDNEVGYIKINRFSANTYEEFMQSLIRLKESGMKKLVLDLRQNPGGFLTAAVNIADEFIDGRNLLVYTEGRTHKRKDYNARRLGMFENGDLAVLIDEGSASASEIVAGAIQDWDRGVLVGRRTFGKGLVQEQYNLENGGALRLTIARYYTPSGRCIQKPYDEGKKAYQKELLDRWESGEFDHEDTIQKNKKDTLIYKTLLKGRKVYGSGGISPDVFVAIDTTGNETIVIRAAGLIPEFVYDYYSNSPTELPQYADFAAFKANFTVSDALYERYIAFVTKELKDDWREKTDRQLMLRDKAKFKTRIKAYVARQIWKNDGLYPIIQELDHGLQEAYKQLKNTK